MTEQEPSRHAIAIIGMSGRFPGCRTLAGFWEKIRSGTELLTRKQDPAEDAPFAPIPARGLLGESDQFDNAFFGLTARDARLLDPQQRLLLECAWEALEDSGYPPDRTTETVSVYATANVSRYREEIIGAASTPAERFAAHVGTVPDCTATRLAYHLDLRGEALSVQSACSSSLVAVALACRSLGEGHSDMAIVGGASLMPTDDRSYRYQPGMIYARDGHCRPFDKDAGGIVEGEGVGAVVLKRLDRARDDRDHVRAVILGTSVNNDGRGKMGFTAPSLTGQAAVVEKALAHAGVGGDTIGYVETHGTGTPLGDPVEVAALARAFATTRTRYCYLGSLKPMTGHLIQAAGIAGLIKTVLALEHGIVPPLTNFRMANPEISLESTPFLIPQEGTPWPELNTPRRASVSSFGVGGTNAHVVLEQAPAVRDREPLRGEVPALLSAATSSALDRMRARLAKHLEEHPELDLRDIAFTLAAGRAALPVRWAAVVENTAELTAALHHPAGLLRGSAAPYVRKWLSGADLHVAELGIDNEARRVSLPPYPFDGPFHPPLAASGQIAGNVNDSPDEILGIVVSACRKVLQQDDLSAEQNLYELGADSLSIVDILIRCEDELDITVPLERFARVRTATEMSDLIRTVQMEAGGIQR